MKLYSICPKCFSQKIHVKIGSYSYKQGGHIVIPEDFGEIYECPDCFFEGANIFEGNTTAIDLLRQKKILQKELYIKKKAEEIKPFIKGQETALIVSKNPKKPQEQFQQTF